jgi:hypothetical protein
MAIQQLPTPKSGIPSGNTAGRPASPVIGDTYYNGQKEALEIYNGTAWVFASAPSLSPTITVADVGTSRAYGSAQGLVTFTENALGGVPEGYTATASTGGYTTTTTSNTANITVGDAGSWTFSATAYNGFGTSSVSPSVTQTLTTVPQAPTIGTATQVSATSDVTVTWTLGATGGKNLSAITITPYLNGTTAQTSQTAATTSATTHTFTGLSYGSSYTFKVSTTNANGVGLESNATNSVTLIQQFNVDFLVVAGGGSTGGTPDGSAQTGCGGGGAGGFRSSVTTSGGNANAQSPILITGGTNYTVTVGAGAAGAGSDGAGSQGSPSVFSNVSTTGGGLGRAQTNAVGGGPGGSGGGAGSTNNAIGNAGAGTSGEGFSGGATNGAGGAGAGGGGAGAAGTANNGGNVGGAGGTGKATNINGTSVTYAGGGGGGNLQDDNPSSGGAGGGGGGGRKNTVNGAPINGTAGTGGGAGGGTRYWGGASGGNGIVILRYPDTATITVGAGLTATTATTGSTKVTTFNAGTGNVSW